MNSKCPKCAERDNITQQLAGSGAIIPIHLGEIYDNGCLWIFHLGPTAGHVRYDFTGKVRFLRIAGNYHFSDLIYLQDMEKDVVHACNIGAENLSHFMKCLKKAEKRIKKQRSCHNEYFTIY